MTQDSISFVLTAEDTVVNTTVKVVANIVGLGTPELADSKLKSSLNDLMQKFIAVPDWQISGINRSGHASGMEQITLTASTRIPESENYALDRRREEASRDGLRIVSVSTDTSPTQRQIDATNSKLRLDLLRRACEEMDLINATGIGDYRIGKVVFDPHSMLPTKQQFSISNSAVASYGSGFAGSDGDIGNAVKLTMLAEVVLRRTVAEPVVERLTAIVKPSHL